MAADYRRHYTTVLGRHVSHNTWLNSLNANGRRSLRHIMSLLPAITAARPSMKTFILHCRHIFTLLRQILRPGMSRRLHWLPPLVISNNSRLSLPSLLVITHIIIGHFEVRH